MMYAVTQYGKRYHIVESQVQVREPETGRTHAYCGDNAPEGSIIERNYLPFTWCGLHVDFTGKSYGEQAIARLVKQSTGVLKPCTRCASIAEKNNFYPEIQ